MENIFLNIKGQLLSRWIISLTTKGCEHAKKSGGCTMCGFFNPADESITDENIVSQFEQKIHFAEQNNVQALDIFVGGSFLNDYEISENVRKVILKKISGIESVKRVFFSSRPEYITDDKLNACRGWLGNKTIEVGLGFESTDDYIRNTILKKNYTRENLLSAVENIKNAECELLVYLLIKPPFLTESQAIEDAVASAQYIFDLAQKYDVPVRVSLEPVHICPDTELEKMFIANEYSLVSLWSVIEVVRRIHQKGTVYVGIGKDDVGLSNDKIPYSCTKCFKSLVNEIHIFNKTQSFSTLENFNCECKASHLGTL